MTEQGPCVELYGFHGGSIVAERSKMIRGGTGTVLMPVMYWLIVHPLGIRILFDSGMHPRCQHHKTTPKRLLEMFEFRYNSNEDVVSRLNAVGIAASDIDYVFVSHFHFDHSGGNSLLPKATIVCGHRDLLLARDPDRGPRFGFDPHDVQSKRLWPTPPTGEYDMCFDGSVVGFPTPGHTPGHQSLRLRLREGTVILTGDACYFCETLKRRALPETCYNEDQFRNSLNVIDSWQVKGACIIPGHDEEVSGRVPVSHGKLNPVTNLDALWR